MLTARWMSVPGHIAAHTLALVLALLTACEPRLDSKDWQTRLDAVEKLTDQAVLARVALEDRNERVCMAAAYKLTDQALLAKVALDGVYAAPVAVAKLTDQSVLARLVLGAGHVPELHDAALARLTDQQELAKVALVVDDERVLAKLNDPVLRARLASPIARASEINKLGDSDPLLLQIAGDTETPTRDARACIARMKLAIDAPRIKSHFPRLQCVVDERGTTSQGMYAARGWDQFARHLDGEHVTIRLREYGKVLAEGSWSTVFPRQIAGSGSFLGAQVSGEDVLKKLLHLGAFTPEDLTELVHSSIVEVRMGAAANLTNPDVLARVASADKSPAVRKAASDALARIR